MKEAVVIEMPEVVRALWKAQQALAQYYVHTGLAFTLDGRLVGDIAEALALEHFDLVVPPKRTPGVDALTRAGRTVQIKATGKRNCGPAFSFGEGVAEYLVFFHLAFETNTAHLLYNGLEAPVRALLPAMWNGTKVIPLADIARLSAQTPPSAALPMRTARAAVAPT